MGSEKRTNVSSIYRRYQTGLNSVGQLSSHIFSQWQRKMLANTGEIGLPIDRPSFWCHNFPLNKKYVSITTMSSNFVKKLLVKPQDIVEFWNAKSSTMFLVSVNGTNTLKNSTPDLFYQKTRGKSSKIYRMIKASSYLSQTKGKE